MRKVRKTSRLNDTRSEKGDLTTHKKEWGGIYRWFHDFFCCISKFFFSFNLVLVGSRVPPSPV